MSGGLQGDLKEVMAGRRGEEALLSKCGGCTDRMEPSFLLEIGACS